MGKVSRYDFGEQDNASKAETETKKTEQGFLNKTGKHK